MSHPCLANGIGQHIFQGPIRIERSNVNLTARTLIDHQTADFLGKQERSF